MAKTIPPLLLWALGFATPFFILMWKWALLILVFVAVISPLVSVIFYTPFKNYATERGSKMIGLFSGMAEGLVTTLLVGYLSLETVTPDLAIFSCLLIFAYVTNQIARVVRGGGEELWVLWGYLTTLPITILVLIVMW